MESSPSTETPAKTYDSEFARIKDPFKVCFPIKKEIGRSNNAATVSVIAPKFYSRAYASLKCSDRNLQRQIDKLKPLGPRDKYLLPNTESQRYGWYQARFCMPNKTDRRINFAKTTHQLIKEHMMNYAKIRE